MRLRALIWFLWPALLVLPTSLAQASEPILVVVEATPDAALSADDIRAEVTAELGVPVLGPSEMEGTTSAETLIIEIGARAAVLVFHPRDGAIRRRKIDLPADDPGRRKTIAWLAQNLVKDQVAGLPEVTSKQTQVEQPVAAPPPSSPLEPPPHSPRPPQRAPEDLPVTAEKAQPTAEARSLWSIAVSGGPTLHFLTNLGWKWDPWRSGNEWEIEAQRSMGTWTAGVALDFGEQDIPLVGLAGFVGDGWQRGNWRLEGTVGAGLEYTNRRVATVHQSVDSRTGAYTTMDVSTELRPRLYGRGNLTLAWRGMRSVDFTLRLGLHVDTDDKMYSYGTALLGLRMNLP